MILELKSAANYISVGLQSSTLSEYKIKQFNKHLTKLLLNEYNTIGYKRTLTNKQLYKQIKVASYIDIVLLNALNMIHLSEQGKILFPTPFTILISKNLVLYKTRSKEVIIYDNSFSNPSYKQNIYDEVPFLYDKRNTKICNIL